MERFDVAIVGAGPAGSSAAISLARKGYSVILLERAIFPREKLCGDFLNPANWPLLERLGVVDEILSLEHEKVTAFRISTFSGAEAAISFPSRNGRTLFGLGLRRSSLDHLLLRSSLAKEAGGWSLSLGDQSKGKRVSSSFLIGADGRNSWVAHRLGLALPGKADKYVAFQTHLRGARGVKGNVQIHCFPGGYAGLVGLGGESANLCFVVENSNTTKKGISLEALLENHLYKNISLRESLKGSEIVGKVRSTYPVHLPPRRSYGDGYLLVGDAARVTEPVTGEGVYFALRSGILAAEVMDLAFKRGNGSAEQIACYLRLCQKAFSFRQRVNRIIGALVYRPFLLAPFLRLSSKTSFPLRPLVDRLCGASGFLE
ncbi:MAG: NAD(P)/FAD-dependent oxidoreductase [Deltaproteobacteria bacterium]|nr:NAD(P)/FAD-dependent oxidoreductase [Deltaproteobacteria bacterium]